MTHFSDIRSIRNIFALFAVCYMICDLGCFGTRSTSIDIRVRTPVYEFSVGILVVSLALGVIRRRSLSISIEQTVTVNAVNCHYQRVLCSLTNAAVGQVPPG